MDHDTVQAFPATVAHSRRAVGARRVRADYRRSTRLRPGRSCARHPGFAIAAMFFTLGTFNGIVQAGDPPPVVVDSIEPAETVQGEAPQPQIQVFGSNLIEGLPSEMNRPTVTFRQPGKSRSRGQPSVRSDRPAVDVNDPTNPVEIRSLNILAAVVGVATGCDQ